MNPRNLIGAVAILIGGAFVLSVKAALVSVTDTDPNLNIFEYHFTATNKVVTIGTNNNVQAMIYQDTAPGAPALVTTNGIPVPLIRVKVGDTIICRFTNSLPPSASMTDPNSASIHWHGIELDNDSDGTGVTQDAVRPGQNYTYRFKTARPGLFWFHSHMLPGTETFAGMYGVILIANTNESALITDGTLPTTNYTHTLALSDIEFNPTNGFIGKFLASSSNWFTINALVKLCHDDPGPPTKPPCNAAGRPGAIVLANGVVPSLTATNITMFDVPSGKRVRLHLLNEALSRNFRLTLRYTNNPTGDTNLYRIGGQGGLLNKARLEGGIQMVGTNVWDTGYGKGEIVIGSGDRADVLIYPTGTNGDIIQLVGNPLPSPPFNLSTNLPSNYPVAYFRISGPPENEPPITTNTVILPDPIEDLRDDPTNALVDPGPLNLPGTNDPVIRLQNGSATTPGGGAISGSIPNIDGIAGDLDANLGDGEFTNGIPHSSRTARYARIGNLIELSVRNETGAVHPFHLHGFSLQPLHLLDNDTGNTNYIYDYNEFVDTIDVHPGLTLVFRVRLDDREKFCDISPNASATNGPHLAPCGDAVCTGAVGRWLFHCHIFLHAGLGMIGEIVVLDEETEFNVKATEPKVLADDFLSTQTGPLTKVRIWGSWRDDNVYQFPCFSVGIWSDVPAEGTNYSRPGQLLCNSYFYAGQYTNFLYASGVNERFFDPNIPAIIGCETNIWEYDFEFPTNPPCVLTNGNIYWLSVTADCFDTNQYLFGWRSSPTNWNDNAVFGDAPFFSQPFSWRELRRPPGYTNSLNLCFDITTETNGPPTNCPPIMLTCASNKTVECGSAWTYDQPTVFDACCGTNYNLTYFAFTNASGPCSQAITFNWFFTDCVGSNAFCSQTVTVVDTTPPVLTCASNKTVQCTDAWSFDEPTVSDACCASNVLIFVVNTVTNGTCPQFATRTWQATDCCNNSTNCSQTVTIMDTVPPMFTCASNKTVQCTDPWSFDQPTAFDACCGSNVTVTILGTVTNGTCPQLVTRTWQAADCCNNSTNCSQTVTIVDTVPPILTCASNKTVQCTDAWSFDQPNAIDACCGTNVTITIVSTVTNGTTTAVNIPAPNNPCSQLITRTWVATDCCSNSTSCTQTVTVVDTTPPVLTCASNKTVQCGTAWTFDLPSAIDACCGTNVTITTLSTITNGGACTQFVSRVWQAVDCCTNFSTTCTQVVTVVDTTLPAITCPSNILVLTCTTNVSVTWSNVASDLCSSVTVTSSPPSGSFFNRDTTNTVTSIARDACGNSNSCTFLVIVRKPILNIAIAGGPGKVVISWADGGILQETTNLLSSWIDVPLASSPYTNTVSGKQKFYRLKCP